MHPKEGESRLTDGVYRGQKIEGISVIELHVRRDRDKRERAMCLRKDNLVEVLSGKKWN